MTAPSTSEITLNSTAPNSNKDLNQTSNRIIALIEEYPAIAVAVTGLGVFGFISCMAIKAGWSPEQIIALSKAFPVKMTIPAINF